MIFFYLIEVQLDLAYSRHSAVSTLIVIISFASEPLSQNNANLIKKSYPHYTKRNEESIFII